MTYYLLISLEKDVERRDELFQQTFFKSNQPEKIFGVDGREMPASAYFGLGVKDHSAPLSPAEVGCSLSHLQALSYFLASDKHSALVLEDDVLGLNAENRPFVDALLQEIGSNEVILLGGLEGLSCKFDIMGKPDDRIDGLWHIPRSMHHWMWRACCYVIGREAAQKIVELQTRWMDKADNWKKFSVKADVRISYFPIASHPIGNLSNIENFRSGKFVSGRSILFFRKYVKKIYRNFWFVFGLRQIHKNN